MEKKMSVGVIIFAICYFLLAILFFYMVYILFSGMVDWALQDFYTGGYISFGEKLFSSVIFGIIPGLWCLVAAVLLYKLNPWGRWMPLPLVFICGIFGMYVLFILLVAHIIYFSRPKIKELFRMDFKEGRYMTINTALKLTLIVALIIISLSIAYYYVIFLPKATKVSTPVGLRGTVIEVHDADRFIVINLGVSAGIKKGIQMLVLRGDLEIGTVTIIQVRKDISAADITHLVSGFRIKEGDMVVSK
jgi:hypothetical protein